MLPRRLRLFLMIAFTYPVWGIAYEIVTGYWPPQWMEPWVDRTRPEPCMTRGGGAPG
jgi:hypothetical protein